MTICFKKSTKSIDRNRFEVVAAFSSFINKISLKFSEQIKDSQFSLNYFYIKVCFDFCETYYALQVIDNIKQVFQS